MAAVDTIVTDTIRDMAMPNDASGDRRRTSNYLTRIAVSILAIAAIAWGGFMLPLFWRQAPARYVAAKFLQGQTFKTRWLLDEAQQVEAAATYPVCNPAVLRNLVVIRLAILNEAVAERDRTLMEGATGPLNEAAKQELTCLPADPLAWLTLFWLDAGKHGLRPQNENYLRLSYALGPNEGWIALWRNRLAFQLFDQLPADLADDASDEFIKLVNTGQLYWETAAIFESATPAAQSRIVEHLKTASAISREAFARVLYGKGLDVTIPGVEWGEARPWR